jgi:Fur family transcriptional regulator, zinc uptake regulator
VSSSELDFVMRRPRLASANTEHVLRVLRSAVAPMTAYDILKSIRSERPWAPPTAYRALTRLVDEGRAHRLESINAYVACRHGHHANAAAVIAICSSCGGVNELPEDRLIEELKSAAGSHGFQIDRTVIELTGRCARCASRPFSNQMPAKERAEASESQQA